MVRQRRCGVAFSAEDFQNKGKVNLGYQNEYFEPEIRVELSCDTISLNDSFTDEVLNDTITRTKKVSFFEGPLGLIEQDVEKDLTFVKNNEDHSVKCAGEHMNVSSLAEKAQREKISTLEKRNEPLRNDAEKEFVGVVTCDPSPSGKHFRTKSKTAKDWMVDPHLYKVGMFFNSLTFPLRPTSPVTLAKVLLLLPNKVPVTLPFSPFFNFSFKYL